MCPDLRGIVLYTFDTLESVHCIQSHVHTCTCTYNTRSHIHNNYYHAKLLTDVIIVFVVGGEGGEIY